MVRNQITNQIRSQSNEDHLAQQTFQTNLINATITTRDRHSIPERLMKTQTSSHPFRPTALDALNVRGQTLPFNQFAGYSHRTPPTSSSFMGKINFGDMSSLTSASNSNMLRSNRSGICVDQTRYPERDSIGSLLGFNPFIHISKDISMNLPSNSTFYQPNMIANEQVQANKFLDLLHSIRPSHCLDDQKTSKSAARSLNINNLNETFSYANKNTSRGTIISDESDDVVVDVDGELGETHEASHSAEIPKIRGTKNLSNSNIGPSMIDTRGLDNISSSRQKFANTKLSQPMTSSTHWKDGKFEGPNQRLTYDYGNRSFNADDLIDKYRPVATNSRTSFNSQTEINSSVESSSAPRTTSYNQAGNLVSNEIDLSSNSSSFITVPSNTDVRSKNSNHSDVSPSEFEYCIDSTSQPNDGQIQDSMITPFQSNSDVTPTTESSSSLTDSQALMTLFLKVNCLLNQKKLVHQQNQELHLSTPTSTNHLDITQETGAKNTATQSTSQSAPINFSNAIQSYLASLGIISPETQKSTRDSASNVHCPNDIGDYGDLRQVLSSNEVSMSGGSRVNLVKTSKRVSIKGDLVDMSNSQPSIWRRNSNTEAPLIDYPNLPNSKFSQSPTKQEHTSVNHRKSSPTPLTAVTSIDFKNIRSFITNSSG